MTFVLFYIFIDIEQCMKRKGVKKSDSLDDLYSELVDAKDKKKVFLKQLKTNVNKSQVLIKKSQSQANIQTKPSSPHKLLNKKQKSLSQLARSINDRISIDRLASIKLAQMSDEKIQKRQLLEKRIEEIKRRNQLRMKQLNQFENKYLKKLNQDYKKDKEKEERLLLEYEEVMQQQGKIKQTQQYRKAIQAEDWKAIIKEKQKLQKMIAEYRKKQQMLLKDQNPENLKKIAEENQVKLIVQQKVQMPEIKKPRVKADAKQIGNQYLQYAKKLKQMPKEKPKIKLLDVNFKCIDYEGDMMNKIARNTGDLSKIRRMQPAAVTIKQAKLSKDNSFKMPVFEIKQDEDTKRYLKQIRTNLKELEKTN